MPAKQRDFWEKLKAICKLLKIILAKRLALWQALLVRTSSRKAWVKHQNNMKNNRGKVIQIDFDPLSRWIWIHRENISYQYRHSDSRVNRLWKLIGHWAWSQDSTMVCHLVRTIPKSRATQTKTK